MTRKAFQNLLMVGLLCGLSSSGLAQDHTPARASSEKAIRAAAYDMMKAFLTQDVPSFKRRAAKRTLELVDLTYEAARSDPQHQQELQNAHVTNSDQFMSYLMLGLATQYLQTLPMSPEAAARRVANESTISFVSNSEASIVAANQEVARAKLVARAWKIDLTDWLKRPILREVKDPNIRARIKSL